MSALDHAALVAALEGLDGSKYEVLRSFGVQDLTLGEILRETPAGLRGRLEGLLLPNARRHVGLAKLVQGWGFPPTLKGLQDATEEQAQRLYKATFGYRAQGLVPREVLRDVWHLGPQKSLWRLSYRSEPAALALADRHYNRQTKGARTLGPPGRTLVLLSHDEKALWVTTWQLGSYMDHEFGGEGANLPGLDRGGWGNPWVNSTFRNEGALGSDGQPVYSSELIAQALEATAWMWGKPPASGVVTFVDPSMVKNKKRVGRCYRDCLTSMFKVIGHTKRGLVVLHRKGEDMEWGYHVRDRGPGAVLDVRDFLADQTRRLARAWELHEAANKARALGFASPLFDALDERARLAQLTVDKYEPAPEKKAA